VALIRAEESYEKLAESFKIIFGQINNMVKNSCITIFEESYNVILYLCCDYKVSQHAHAHRNLLLLM